jgi:hypothetical protein
MLLPLVLVVAHAASAAPPSLPRRWTPPRPLDDAEVTAVLAVLAGEPFPDGKLRQLEWVTLGQRRTVACAQAVRLLGAFDFWYDRVAALRLLPLHDREHLALILAYFTDAPGVARSQARAILALP